MNNTKKKQCGFTLLEMLIAVAILGIIFLVLTNSFLGITRGSVKSELIRDLKQSGDFSVGIMEQMIRGAADITSSCSGTIGNSLTLTGTDGFSTQFLCVFDAGNQVARLASRSGATTLYLTPQRVTLGTDCTNSSLQFTCTTIPGQPMSVLIRFTLSQKGSSGQQSFETAQTQFQTTVNVRNL